MYGEIFRLYIFSNECYGENFAIYMPVYKVIWKNFKSKVLVQDKLDRADSFCKIFVILCSFKNIHSPIDQTAKKESDTHRGQR
jgi:hypothetical protein